jgi:hypothetical protein
MNLNKIALCLVLTCLTTLTQAQTADHRWSIAIGGGPMDYKSNLGNGFSLSKKTSWHGAALMQVGNYLNPSLDLAFFASMGDLSATRLKSVGIALKYKFANGYLLDESNALKPYIYLGGAFNNLTDRLNYGKVPETNYMSLNGGLGVRYNVFWRLDIGYNLAIAGFLADKKSVEKFGASTEAYLHNAILLSVDL